MKTADAQWVAGIVLHNIESAFREFDEITRAPEQERARLTAARDGVADALAGDPRVLRVVDAGSYRHGTEVGGRSWFDVLVVLSGKPSSVARAVDLVNTVASGRGDAVNALVAPLTSGSAVTAPSGALPSRVVAAAGAGLTGAGAVGSVPPGIRLVPAFEAPAGLAAPGGDIVLVADAARHWVASRVGAREILLNRVDDGTMRPLIRLVLAWKHRVRAAVSSYYLETAVIRQALQQPSFSPLWDLCWAFEQLAADDLMTLTDVSSPNAKPGVRASASMSKRIETGYLVDAAAAMMRSAVNASIDDDWQTVSERLRALFGPHFPDLDG
ncbi:hypothetical protein [Subtercola sp. YIM 133946]|uniref:hypothetical protein n=1 Tax=Subtercola sp. YIM 133946 TaxID=3118909 RepID=UPI002F93EFDB